MPKTKVEVYDKNQLIYPYIESDHVTFSNGMKVNEMLDQSISMPTVTHEDLSFKVGVGDQDVSSAIVDSSVSKMTIKGKTYQNILPEPSTHVLTNNKEMFKVNEGLNPNVEIVDGVSKSAILKGQTLVNLSGQLTHHEKWVETGDDLVLNLPSGNGQPNINVGLVYKLKKDTIYTVVINMKSYETGYPHICFMDESNRQLASDREWTPTTTGVLKTKFTTSSTVEAAFLRIIPRNGIDNIYTINKNIIILEGDYTNTDIPYFEGMASVKAPVLKSTGKNLIDFNNYYSAHLSNGRLTMDKDNKTLSGTSDYNDIQFYVYLVKGRVYNFSASGSYYTKSQLLKNKTAGYNEANKIQEISIPGSFMYIGETGVQTLHLVNIRNMYNIQLEEGSQATSYEPYKSNVLHTPEEVILRSVENAQDTINLNTGEYVQRIGEVILNGSEPWHVLDNNTENTIGFALRNVLPFKKTGDKYVRVNCDKLPSHKENLWNNDKIGCVTENNINQDLNDTQLQVRVLKSTLSTQDSNGFKSWLQTNPLTIQYILETPVVKTVDLSSSGNWEKVVFDGSENWSLNEQLSNANGYYAFYHKPTDGLVGANRFIEIDCDNFTPTINDSLINKMDSEWCTWHGWSFGINICIKGDRLLTKDANGFKQWLRDNPTSVWYPINSVKDSTQVKQPIFFKDGHIIQSSGTNNSLIPTLDYQAKTSNSYVMDLMKTNTRYTMKAKSANGTFTIDGTSYNVGTNTVFTSPSSITNKFLVMSNKTNEEVMILEGDVASKTIPYFKGIKSAFEGESKIEVLSTGKNLFDGAFEKGVIDVSGNLGYSSSAIRTVNYISVKPNTSYHINLLNLEPFESLRVVYVHEYDENLKVLGETQVDNRNIYTSKSATRFIKINTHTAHDLPVNSKMIVCENSIIDKQYEPYKSNSTKIPLLSPLRSLPNGVCDELIIDRMQKKVTLIQRVGEQMYDGSNNESWCNGYGGATGNRNKFEVSLPYISKAEPLYSYSNHFICERIDGVPNNDWAYRAYANGSILYFLFSPDARTVELHNVDKWKKWLQANPLTVFYPLATPVITEVDLEGFPYIYKDGHIFLNSEIVPVTEIIYSVNQCQQISASNEDIIRHEKELTYLQKLIAQYIQVDYESVLLSLKV